MSMTKHRHDQILAAQISSAQKVYDAIPVADRWTHKQISTEVFRRGLRMEANHVEGCIAALVDAGLVRECAGRTYRRAYSFPLVEAKPRHDISKMEFKQMDDAPTKQAKPTDPFAKLASASTALRKMADEIDEAVLDAMQQLEAARTEGGSKLAAVREALKGLING